MKEFLLIYQGGEPDWMEKWSPEKQQNVMAQWGAWFKELEASGNLRIPGAALTPEGTILTRNGGDIVTDSTMPEVKELIGGFSVIQAESLSRASEIAKGSPYLAHNPQGSILVRSMYAPEAGEESQ